MDAFDISKESPAVAERYGSTPWGQIHFDGTPTGGSPAWHSSRSICLTGIIILLLSMACPNMRVMDQCVGALMTDLVERNLLIKYL